MPASFRYRGIHCAPIAADGRLPFEDNQFDAAVSIEVIEHVENQFGFFRELTRIIKPGGIVVVTTPNTLNANSRVASCSWLASLRPSAVDRATTPGGHIRNQRWLSRLRRPRAGLSQLSFTGSRQEIWGNADAASGTRALARSALAATPTPAQVARGSRRE
jgi:cyclopropane fatty-acyl-phospholipid synthase-like methyltransferase